MKVKELMKMEGLAEDSKPVVSPGIKTADKDLEAEDDMELTKQEVKEFRGAAARLNYLGQDRPDVQFCTKEICQRMSKPTVGGRIRIKRVVRYLVGAEEVVWTYGEMQEDGADAVIDVYVDSDWAGGADRKSTSGGVVVLSGAAIKHWSRTQKSRALSSTEAEYYAIVTGAAEGIGMCSLAEDLGWRMKIRVWTDSSGGKAAASRRGLGKLRHVELKYLWVQELVRSGKIKMMTVRGEDNVADHLTKIKSRDEVAEKLRHFGGELKIKDTK